MDNNMNYQQFQQPIKEKRNPIVIVLIIKMQDKKNIDK